MTARARTGCQPCRVRHLKCDQATPICGRCKTFERECTRGYPYRVYFKKFADDQSWLKTPNDLTFVDETQSLANNYDEEVGSEGENSPQDTGHPDTPPSTHFSHTESPHSPSRDPSRSRSRTIPSTIRVPSLDSPSTPTFGPLDRQASLSNLPGLHRDTFSHLPSPVPSTSRGTGEINNNAQPAYHDGHNSFDDDVEIHPTPSIYLDKPVWPLTNPQEARLLRHFVQNLAIWLDLCDPKQHFQLEVPLRAGTCPILLNAIFALSSRHLSITDSFDSFASNRYHQECLKYLIPMLNNTATVSDETLFAASIILRVLEEIDLLETDLQGHMLGIQVFVSALNPYDMRGGLSEAAFWVGLRQEIYVATIRHRAVQISLEHCVVDRSVEPTSDFGWANRAVVHCADVLNCCFGPSGVSLNYWTELKESSERWMELRPSSFTPIYRREPDRENGEAFPEIWHSHACHIIGVQHHKLAQILLSIFDPRIPRVGGSRSVAVRSMEAEIKPYLRELCGIGLYNRWTPPGMFTASMGIAICGERFDDKIDQDALLDILVRTERDHARPTAAVQKQLKEAWA